MLAVSFFSVVGEYIRLLLFICLPVVVVATGLAVWLHYRQKSRKRLVSAAAEDAGISFSVPDASELISFSPLANEDKFNLVKECKKQLARSRAKFLALKHDLTLATNKLSLQGITGNNSAQMQSLLEKVNAYELQVSDLQHKLEVLHAAVPIQGDIKNLLAVIEQKESELLRLTRMLTERNEQVKDSENMLAETKQHTNLLHTFAAGNTNQSTGEILN